MLYLVAYSQKVKATGLTFYDDEVTEFFFTPSQEQKYNVQDSFG